MHGPVNVKMFYHVLQATGYMHHALNLLKYNAFARDLVFVLHFHIYKF